MLDNLEKLTKILLSGVAAIVISYAGYNINWQKLGLEKDQFCFDYADDVEALVSRRTETIPDRLIKRYAEQCDVSSEQAAEILNEQKVDAELASAPPQIAASPQPESAQGYVALGKVEGRPYSQVNFNFAGSGKPAIENGKPPKVQDVLSARWSVNVRENTSVTTGSSNPIESTLMQGECIRVLTDPAPIRGQYWAKVARAPCGT